MEERAVDDRSHTTPATEATDGLFDPLNPEVLKDPYPAYRRLREADPVHWHPQMQSWILTRYADCLFALRDSELFAADFRRVGLSTAPELLSIQTLDPPEQTPLRDMLADGLRTQDLAGLERAVTRHVERLLADLAPRETFDFVTEFADPLALATICRFFGIDAPEEDDNFVRLNADLDHSMDSGLAPDAEQAGLRARAHFNALVTAWLAGSPDRGMLGYVASNRARGGVTHDVLVNSLRAFFHAGFEVPSRFLGNAMLALLRQPGAIDSLRHSVSMESALEELVRFAGPVQAVSRACTRDVRLAGKSITRGDIVVVLIGAANRDPEQFNDPDRLILDRQPNPHVGFGRGSHSCLGFHIGLMQARATISAVVRQHPALRLAGEPVIRPTATLRGLAHLPVALA